MSEKKSVGIVDGLQLKSMEQTPDELAIASG